MVRAVCPQLPIWLDQGFVTRMGINVSVKEFFPGDPAKVVETEAAARHRAGETVPAPPARPGAAPRGREPGRWQVVGRRELTEGC